MADAGFVDVQSTDVSSQWLQILHERLNMYASLEQETVARFGRKRFETWMGMYTFFIEHIDAGTVGGGRFIGWKR